MKTVVLAIFWLQFHTHTFLFVIGICTPWHYCPVPQISLGDYLKRPRKPPDQRKPPPLPPAPLPDPPVVSSYMTSLQTSSSSDVTPTTTGYTAVSPTTAGTTPLSSSMTPSASGSGGLQFEPVSPGDEDGTPPLVTMEGVSTSTAQTHTHTVMLRVSYTPVLHVISVCGHNLIGYNFRLLSTIKMSHSWYVTVFMYRL